MPKQATLAFTFKRTRAPGGMLKKELAQALGISGSMVSRLAKRGMPTDSVARAERWRRRHLEPGRVKGQRLDTIKDFDLANRPLVFEGVDPRQLRSTVVDMGLMLHGFYHVDARYAPQYRWALRDAIRRLPPGFRASFTTSVWLALIDYALSEAEVEKIVDLGPGLHDSTAIAFAVSRSADDFEPDYWWGVACAGPVERQPEEEDQSEAAGPPEGQE